MTGRDKGAPARLLTFASGGWVLVAAGLLTLIIMAWALAPALLSRHADQRPRGDGRNIETYGFDLSNLQVDRSLIAAAARRDEIPVLTNPSFSSADEAQAVNDPKYSKYLVSNDRVIGVTINGESRAYPLHVMYVHEIVNDVVGGKPIAVTYNWLTDSVVVFDRTINGRTLEFGFSGLVYNSNLLMYDRAASDQHATAKTESPHAAASESLWSQLLATAISGPQAGAELHVLDSELARWTDWIRNHPQTTVLNRDLRIAARYKKAAPTQYFQSAELMFPVQPLPDAASLAWKTPVVAVMTNEGSRVYPMPWLAQRGREAQDANPDQPTPVWIDHVGAVTLQFVFDPSLQTVRVEAVDKDGQSDAPDQQQQRLRVTHAFWFGWHAMNPDHPLAKD